MATDSQTVIFGHSQRIRYQTMEKTKEGSPQINADDTERTE
jgi:hypothetical protein